jgi:hypothetical protein
VTSTSSVPGPVTSGRRPLTPGPVSRVSSSDPITENNVSPILNKLKQLIKKQISQELKLGLMILPKTSSTAF